MWLVEHQENNNKGKNGEPLTIKGRLNQKETVYT